MANFLKSLFGKKKKNDIPEIITETKKCMHCLRRINAIYDKCPHCRSSDFII